MKIPLFWAEGRLRHTISTPRRQVTLRRWGWSDTSQEDAQALADKRVKQALDDLIAQGWPRTGSVQSREPKTSYNGSEGNPIREEIVATYGHDVATRNSYGAVCLNTPDVMIVDLDEDDLRSLPSPLASRTGRILSSLVAVGALAWMAIVVADHNAQTGAVGVGHLINLFPGFAARFIIMGGFTYAIAHIVRQAQIKRAGGAGGWLKTKLETQGGRWAVYRTPAGARAIRLDRTMDPTSDESDHLMRDLNSDKLYRQMCLRQACYRARVTPKPWRLPNFTRWNGPVWPLDGEKLNSLRTWTTSYDLRRDGWGACEWIEDVGTSPTNDRCQKFREIHDALALPPTSKDVKIA